MADDYIFDMPQNRTLGLPFVPKTNSWNVPVSEDMLRRMGVGGEPTVAGYGIKPAPTRTKPQPSHSPWAQDVSYPETLGPLSRPQPSPKRRSSPRASGGGPASQPMAPALGPLPQAGGGGYTDTFSYTRPQNPWETPDALKFRKRLADMVDSLMNSINITPSMGLSFHDKKLYAQTIPARITAAHQLAEALGNTFANKGTFDLSAMKEGMEAGQQSFNNTTLGRYYTGMNQNEAQKNALLLEELMKVGIPESKSRIAHNYMTGRASQTSAAAAMLAAQQRDPEAIAAAKYAYSQPKDYLGEAFLKDLVKDVGNDDVVDKRMSGFQRLLEKLKGPPVPGAQQDAKGNWWINQNGQYRPVNVTP